MSCIKKFDKFERQKLYEALIILKERPRIDKKNEDFSNVLNCIFNLFSNVKIIFYSMYYIKIFKVHKLE